MNQSNIGIQHFFKEAEKKLTAVYPISEVQALCREWLLHRFQLKMHQLNMLDRIITPAEYALLESDLKRLLSSEPLQYVLGKASFMHMELIVNTHVLIPRPETEELALAVINYCKHTQPNETIKVLDIGTGSGCIALAIATSCRNVEVYACDISAEALEVAQSNAQQLHVHVVFEQTDILTEHIPFAHHQFDVIVSNPPYVTKHEQHEMHPNVLQYEPHQALFVPDDDPFIFYKRIAHLATQRLKPGGYIFFEINKAFANETIVAIESEGIFECKVFRDMHGNDRILEARLSDTY